MNLHSLGDPKDLRADDNGVWKRMGAPITLVSLHKGRYTGMPKVIRRSKIGTHFNRYKISRIYYRHSNSKDFHRIITTVQGQYWNYIADLYIYNLSSLLYMYRKQLFFYRFSGSLPTIGFYSVCF